MTGVAESNPSSHDITNTEETARRRGSVGYRTGANRWLSKALASHRTKVG